MSDRGSGDFLKGLLVGGALGAVLALLYAPKSGRETREELGDRVDELYGKTREEYEAALEKTRHSYEAAVSRLRHLEEDARQKAHEMEHLVEDLVEKGSETVTENRGRLKEAVDAARNAFRAEKEGIDDVDGEDAQAEADDDAPKSKPRTRRTRRKKDDGDSDS